MLRSLPTSVSIAAPAATIGWPATVGHGFLLACLTLLLAALSVGGLRAGDTVRPLLAASADAARSLPDDGLPPAPHRRASPVKKSRITTLTVRSVPAAAEVHGHGLAPCRLRSQPMPCAAIVPAVESLVTSAGVHPALQLPPGQAPPAA